MNNDVFGHEWANSAIFTSGAFTSQNDWRINPQMTKIGYLRQTVHYFKSYMILRAQQHREID